jgi:hypothetical protein
VRASSGKLVSRRLPPASSSPGGFLWRAREASTICHATAAGSPPPPLRQAKQAGCCASPHRCAPPAARDELLQRLATRCSSGLRRAPCSSGLRRAPCSSSGLRRTGKRARAGVPAVGTGALAAGTGLCPCPGAAALRGRRKKMMSGVRLSVREGESWVGWLGNDMWGPFAGVFQKPMLFHQTAFCFCHSCFPTSAFSQPTTHSSFSKNHSPTKQGLSVSAFILGGSVRSKC